MPQSPDLPVVSRPSGWLIGGCLLSVYVIWGTTYFAIKVGVQGAPPFFLIGTRFVVAGGLLTIWQLLNRRKAPTVKQWRNAALLGFLLLVVGNGGQEGVWPAHRQGGRQGGRYARRLAASLNAAILRRLTFRRFPPSRLGASRRRPSRACKSASVTRSSTSEIASRTVVIICRTTQAFTSRQSRQG